MFNANSETIGGQAPAPVYAPARHREADALARAASQQYRQQRQQDQTFIIYFE